MERLPLFPLNTVLFPGMPLYLHIFEDRYKLMVGRCVERREPFGVVLIKAGSEVEGLGPAAEPYVIGCTAHITQVQPLGDGRLNIVAIGHERFKIVSAHHDQPYMTGDIEYLPFHSPGSDMLRRRVHILRGWLERYLRVLEQLENVPFDSTQLPKDPLSLTYLAASLLRLPSDEKQDLLVEDDALRLVETLQSLYRRETTFLEIMSTPVTTEAAGPFSLN
jgi:uncharacterized protein